MITHEVNYFSPKAKPVVVTGTGPAAGAEISETVPDGEVWELQSVQLSLVTDATAVNRNVELTLDDGSTVFFRVEAGINQSSSATTKYSFADFGFASGSAVHDTVAISLPTFVLPAGSRIKTVTASLQAGDDWGAPVLYVVKGSNS